VVGVAPGVRASSSVLYGREGDIARIQDLLNRVHHNGAALMISGEPGIGKSSLLELSQRLAEASGMHVLVLCGVPSESRLPYGALHQALAAILEAANALPALQRFALQAAFGLSENPTAPDRFLVGLATLTLLTASAANKPILLVADDVQWVDQPSRDVLAFVSRRLNSDPIVLLMAARDTPELALAFSGMAELRLSRLDASASEQLLTAQASDLPHQLRSRFLEEAAGNPLALVELPRARRGPDVGASQWLALTDRLERAFSGRVRELPARTQTLLLVIAENDSKSLGEVLEAGELLFRERAGLDALSPAVRAQLIEVGSGEVRFLHPLVRSAVHQGADVAARHDVHAALANVISDTSDRRTWHRLESAIGLDEALAGELDDVAIRSQRRGALSTAITALENAARLSGADQPRSERLLRAAGLCG
jgi:hypothetical protein